MRTARIAVRTPDDDVAADAALVRRALAGDDDAYAALVRRYQTEMFRYARGIGLDYDAAHDAVQDAFVAAYERLDRCRDAARFRQWLMRIVRNRCIDYQRDVRRRTVPLVLLEAAPVRAARETPELRSTLRQAFARISPLLRDAFLLKFHSGYTYDEMAEIAGATPSAMKMRVQRARHELQALLDDTAT